MVGTYGYIGINRAGTWQALASNCFATFELIDELEGILKQWERLASQLERLINIGASSPESLAYDDIDKHLRTQIGQLIDVAVSLGDAARKRIDALSPKASLLRHRLEYLETRRAIGMVSEEVYVAARNELMGRAGDVEDSMMHLMKLVDELEKVMLRTEALFKVPTRRGMGQQAEKGSGSTIIVQSTEASRTEP